MRRFAQVALLACLPALASGRSRSTTANTNVPADIRAWFKGVIAPNGVPCCDISDGHRTEYDVRAGACGCRSKANGWRCRARHHPHRGNPVGEAVV